MWDSPAVEVCFDDTRFPSTLGGAREHCKATVTNLESGIIGWAHPKVRTDLQGQPSLGSPGPRHI